MSATRGYAVPIAVLLCALLCIGCASGRPTAPADRTSLPRFSQPQVVIHRAPGQESAVVRYAIDNPTDSPLRFKEFHKLCGCYAVDPSSWKDIPPQSTGLLLLSVDISRFTLKDRKPVWLDVQDDTGTVHELRSILEIVPDCPLEITTGYELAWTLPDAGVQTIRLRSSAPELIAGVEAVPRQAWITATVANSALGADVICNLQATALPEGPLPVTSVTVVVIHTNGGRQEFAVPVTVRR